MKTRLDCLYQLVHLGQWYDKAKIELGNMGWDSAASIIIIEAKDIKDVLSRYLRGDISKGLLQDWADSIECREDIEYCGNSKEELKEIIVQLANPELTQAISTELVQSMLEHMNE